MATMTSKVLPAGSGDGTPAEPITNPRGIPVFPFMSNVSDYVKDPSETEAVLGRFQEMISKYQFMQQNVERRALGLKEKLPEMKRTLDVVKFLRKRKTRSAVVEEDALNGVDDATAPSDTSNELETTFQLQDTLYAHATVNMSSLDEVYLWLGANVMVAYPLAEAEELLQAKLDKAKESLKAAADDLEFLQVQVTTLEVAIARVHNWDVGEKRKKKLEGNAQSGESKKKD